MAFLLETNMFQSTDQSKEIKRKSVFITFEFLFINTRVEVEGIKIVAEFPNCDEPRMNEVIGRVQRLYTAYLTKIALTSIGKMSSSNLGWKNFSTDTLISFVQPGTSSS